VAMHTLETSVAYMRDKFVPFADAKLSIASAPVLYGLCIYTVIMVKHDPRSNNLHIFRLKDHWTRLIQSAKIMDFGDFLETWNYEKFEKTAFEALKHNQVQADALIRITVYVDEIMSGTRMRGLTNSLSMMVMPASTLFGKPGIEVMVSSWQRTSDAAVPARAKINGSYANSSLMKNEALINGYDDALSLDERGHVCESTVANVFLVRERVVITPENAASLLEGITRRSIIELAHELDIPIECRAVDRSELYIADEIFLSGTTARLTPVLSVDRRQVGNGTTGPVTKQLMVALESASSGTNKRYKTWLTTLSTVT
jgi:branched-chain amino acid aminotransferase